MLTRELCDAGEDAGDEALVILDVLLYSRLLVYCGSHDILLLQDRNTEKLRGRIFHLGEISPEVLT